MVGYRIADARHPIFDPTGAMLHGGRWNSQGLRVIYAAETYAGALLEILIHSNFSHPPRNHRVVRIEIPVDILVEDVAPAEIPGWDAADGKVSRTCGDAWFHSMRTAVLRVPGVITQGREHNLVINADHPDFHRIRAGTPEVVLWDSRLFDR